MYPRWLDIADSWIALSLAPLAIWILVNGLDDLLLDLACFARWMRARFLRREAVPWPSEADLESVE